MKHFVVALIASLLPSIYSHANINVIPLPTEVTELDGTYTLPHKLTISYNDESIKLAAEYLRQLLAPATGFEIKTKRGHRGDIRLFCSNRYKIADEAYTLTTSNSKGISIKSSGYKGIIHGISTLRQLLPIQIESGSLIGDVTWTIPAVKIKDEPRFEWRGLMLDPVRHFFTVDETKHLLDLMALYKFSKFHWHLVDSQAWRIEIKKYPLLTSKGCWRISENEYMDNKCREIAKRENDPSFLLPESNFKLVDGVMMYGGFYTQDEIREIVEYASIRGIDIVPEIDMPGHSGATTYCYPEYSCDGLGEPMCIGNDATLEFARDVFTEVFDLFPYEYAEIGGDEVNREKWKRCPKCQERIRKENLAGVEELQAWFTSQMEVFFNENGRRLIGWDEILEGGVSSTAVINWWRGDHPEVIANAFDNGNEVICCPTDYCYLDYNQAKYTTRKLYEASIVPSGIEEDKAKLVKGMQANIWTEMIPSESRMQYMAFPRAIALSEKAWTDKHGSDWDSFVGRLEHSLRRLAFMGVAYCPLD